MGQIGGPVQEVSIKGRIFPAAADSEASISLGGYNNAVEPNGDGSARKVMTRMSWGIKGVAVAIDHNRDDPKFLQDIADRQEMVAISITLVDSNVYSGKGTIVGEIDTNLAKATCPVEFGGGGKLEKQ